MVIDELADWLVTGNVGTRGSNILLGSRALIPKGNGPYLSLNETGGSGPTRIHNEPGAHTQRPSVQVLVRGKLYSETRTMAKNAYLRLDGVFNTYLGTVFYQKIVAMQEPTDLGLDSLERPMISFNLDIEKVPS